MNNITKNRCKSIEFSQSKWNVHNLKQNCDCNIFPELWIQKVVLTDDAADYYSCKIYVKVSEFVISFTSHKKREFLGRHFLWARPGRRHEEGCWLRRAHSGVKLKPSGGSFFSICMLSKFNLQFLYCKKWYVHKTQLYTWIFRHPWSGFWHQDLVKISL